jgi:hypothetical protein
MITVSVLLTPHGGKEEKATWRGKKRDKCGRIDGQNKIKILE